MPAAVTDGRPRVLMTTDAVGGVWRYAVELASGFAGRGVETVLAVLGPGVDAAQRAEAEAVPGLRLVQTGLALDWTAEDPAALARASNGLMALAALTGVSAVHLHAPALLGAGTWPAPVVVVAHSCVVTWWAAVRGGAMPADFQWRREAAGAGLRKAGAVIAPSVAHAAALGRVYGALDVAVVHNGRTPVAGQGRRDRAVLTAGRLWDEGKNLAALDRAAALLDTPVRAAGPVRGPNGAEVTAAHVELLGNLTPTDLADAYAQASVFASMARYEPFGLAVLEAAQAGLRLVLSDIPTFRELWDGAAVFVADQAGLAPALRAALAAEGDGGARERSARYSVDAMVEGTWAVHRRLGGLA